MKKHSYIMRNFLMNLLSFLSLGLLILLWMAASNGENSFLPSPYEVWMKSVSLSEKPIAEMSMLGHSLESLRRVFIGLLAATIIGIPLGTMIGWNKKFRAIFQPIFEIIRPIPPLAWVPLISIWCGVFEISKYILVFIGTFSAVVVNTYSGVNLANRDNISVGRMFGARGARLIVDIVFPSALPSIMAGLKTALTTGWGVVLAAEMISAKSGLGMLITRGSDSNDIQLVLVAMILIGIIGALMSTAFTVIERRLSPWRTDLN